MLIKMAASAEVNTMKLTQENSEICATEKAEAIIKTAVSADKVDSETITVLEGMVEDYETWNSNFRNELLKRESLYAIKYQHDDTDKISVIANKNFAMFFCKKKVNLLQIIEGARAFETHKELVEMTPNKNAFIRGILAEAALVLRLIWKLAYYTIGEYSHVYT